MAQHSFVSLPSIRPVLVTLVSFLGACGDSVIGVDDVSSISVGAISETLTAIGQQVTATAELRDRSGNVITGIGVSWSTSDADVVRVTNAGLVTAEGNGRALVIATVGALADSAEVEVDQVVQTVAVTYPFDTLFALGVRARLNVQVTDANGVDVPASHAPRTWTVSDADVASVDDEGRVTPLAAGAVTTTLAVGSSESAKELVVAPLDPIAIDLSLAEALQWAIEDALPPTDQFGVSAAVILENGDEWVGVSGWSSTGSRLRPTAISALGSIAKSAAGALLLTVIDDGAVGLDDAVGDVLPPITNVTPTATLRQLLNNSSGIANYALHPNIGDSVFADTSRLWTHGELLERFTGPSNFTPGDHYLSSNTGFVLALMVASSATGTDHYTLMRERLFEPFSLGEEIGIIPWEEWPDAIEPGWWMDGNGQLVEFSQFMSTSLLSSRAIGLVATARAMAVFFREFVAGDLLSPALRAEALTSIPDDGLIPGQIGAGLGLRRYNYVGGEQWGHSGAVSNGSGIVFHDVDLGVTISVLFTVNPPAHQGVHFTLAPQMLGIVRDAGG